MSNSLELNMSRVFKCDSKTLFNAIGEGMLFKGCGSINERSNIDFKEGGKYKVEWEKHPTPTEGEFIEIDPYEKIVFTWKVNSIEDNQNTLVTINIKEHDGRSTLTLVHSGFSNDDLVEQHYSGWNGGLNELRKMFKELYSKIENNPSGLDLYFKINKNIFAPINKVFNAIIDHKEQEKYFTKSTSKSFKEGLSSEWTFNHPGHSGPYILNIQQVIENKLIKFNWSGVDVCFSLRKKSETETFVTIEATGFKATSEGLSDSYDECSGWTAFLFCLKAHVEA